MFEVSIEVFYKVVGPMDVVISIKDNKWVAPHGYTCWFETRGRHTVGVKRDGKYFLTNKPTPPPLA